MPMGNRFFFYRNIAGLVGSMVMRRYIQFAAPESWRSLVVGELKQYGPERERESDQRVSEVMLQRQNEGSCQMQEKEREKRRKLYVYEVFLLSSPSLLPLLILILFVSFSN